MSAPAIPAAEIAQAPSRQAPPSPEAPGTRRGGWFVRITIVVIVLLWLIPTLGVLITSFRPENLVDTTGWWTALAHPFRAAAVDARELPAGAGPRRARQRVPEQPGRDDPVHGDPDHDRRLRRVRVLLDGVQGPVRAVRGGRRAAGRAAADGADPAPAAVRQRRDDRPACIVFPDLDLNGTFLGIWLAHAGFGLPLAIYLLRNYIGSLPSSIIESAKIDGADHFTIFWRLVVPLSVPALAAFAIFQFLWVWNDLLVAYVFLGGTRQTMVLHDRARRAGG